jgi:hypothetical protein
MYISASMVVVDEVARFQGKYLRRFRCATLLGISCAAGWSGDTSHPGRFDLRDRATCMNGNAVVWGKNSWQPQDDVESCPKNLPRTDHRQTDWTHATLVSRIASKGVEIVGHAIRQALILRLLASFLETTALDRLDTRRRPPSHVHRNR